MRFLRKRASDDLVKSPRASVHACACVGGYGPTACAPFVNLNTNLASLIFPLTLSFILFIGWVVTLPENATTYARDILFMGRVE